MTDDVPIPPISVEAASRSRGDQRWEDLADLVLIVAREILFRGYSDERAVRLSPSEGMVMRYVQHDPAAPPSRIAATTGLQRTNLSAVLRGLEHKGLIERRASPDDRRGVTVHPTELGVSNYALVRKEWGTAVSSAVAADPRGLDTALRLLARIETGLIETRPQTSQAPTGEIADSDT